MKDQTKNNSKRKYRDDSPVGIDDFKKTVIGLTQLMTDLIGTQRETLKMLSTLGKMTMDINNRVDALTKLVINSTKIITK